ncbi:MAG: TIGR02266 family protein [Myxococcota bacterium]
MRKTPRHLAEVKVDYRSVGRFITDYSQNVSTGGLFIKTSAPLGIGERVRIRLTLPDGEAPFALDGVVRWVADRHGDHPAGMGVEFLDFDEEARRRVEALVEAQDP